MFKTSFFISSLGAMILIFTSSCGNRISKNLATIDNLEEINLEQIDDRYATNPDIDRLWSMLNGYWKCINTTAGTENLDGIFYFYGNDDEHKPISYLIWGYEMYENEYVTGIEVMDKHRYRVTLETPANKIEGKYDIHEAYSDTFDFDLSHYADKKITIFSTKGIRSEWEYAGKTIEIE